MSEAIPIRPGIQPELDLEREMLDYLQSKIDQFTKETGAPPTRVAIVLLGAGADGRSYDLTHSWDLRDEHPRIATCSLAAALLTKRAIGA